MAPGNLTHGLVDIQGRRHWIVDQALGRELYSEQVPHPPPPHHGLHLVPGHNGGGVVAKQDGHATGCSASASLLATLGLVMYGMTPAQIKAAAPARTGVRKREACFLACRMSSVVGVMI